MRGAFRLAVSEGVPTGPVGDLDAAEAELVAALRSAADSVLGPANSSRRRMGWQVDHAEELRAMAAARRELAERPGLSDAARRQATHSRRAHVAIGGVRIERLSLKKVLARYGLYLS